MMTSKMTRFFLMSGVLSLIFLANTASAATSPGQLRTLTLDFPAGGHVLTPAMKQELEKFVADMRSTKGVGDVYIAAYADQLRVDGQKSLPERDRAIAANRADAVEDYLEDKLKVDDVDSYNMAKRAWFMSRALDTTKAQVKGDAPVQDADPLPAAIRSKEKASRVVVVAELDT